MDDRVQFALVIGFFGGLLAAVSMTCKAIAAISTGGNICERAKPTAAQQSSSNWSLAAFFGLSVVSAIFNLLDAAVLAGVLAVGLTMVLLSQVLLAPVPATKKCS